jgi:glycosyltransferase involved in cell wall biosynthesis
MQKAWVLLLPSVKEGWGMVVTESGACGTTAIVSGVTGLRDSVVDGKTGLILSSNPSEDELAEAIMRLIKENELRENLSNGAYQYSQNFNWDKSYKEFKKLILA